MRRVLLISATAAGLLSGCIPYHLQQTPAVKGKVVDAVTHQPIAGARLRFDRYPDAVAVTGDQGEFDLNAIRRWQLVPLAPYDRFYAVHLLISAPDHSVGDFPFNPGTFPVDSTFPLQQQ